MKKSFIILVITILFASVNHFILTPVCAENGYIFFDNEDKYFTKGGGGWETKNDYSDVRYGKDYVFSSVLGAWAKWSLPIESGYYELFFNHLQGMDNDKNTKIIIKNANNTDTIICDFTKGVNGYISIGIFQLDDSSYVKIINQTNGKIITADCVKLEKMEAPPIYIGQPFMINNNQVIDRLESNIRLDCNIPVIINDNRSITGMVILALYDDDKMLNCALTELTAFSQTDNLLLSMNIHDINESCYVRVFLFDESFRPFADFLRFSSLGFRYQLDSMIEFDASYNTAGFFINYPNSESVCKVTYKKIDEDITRTAHTPKFIPSKNGFSGGFVRLQSGSAYDIKVEIKENNILIKSFSSRMETISSSLQDIYDKAPRDILTLVPTFENCSFYLPYDLGGYECRVSYKGVGSVKAAYPPYNDTVNKEFRGSIVNLTPDTEYEVTAEILSGGQVIKSYINTVKTWSESPPISKTVYLSEIYSSGALFMEGIEGSQEGWIKIKGDTTINGGTANDALVISNCKYLILEGLNITGGQWGGINITNTSKNIRITDCDISKWGQVVYLNENDGKYYNSSGSAVNNNASAIQICNAEKIVIEKNYIHDSLGKTNAWSGPTWSSVHPVGPSGISVASKGGLVIRYNDITGSNEYRFQDAIAGKNNSYIKGGIYKDSDIYANEFAFGQDDGLELDGGQVNVRVYNNKLEDYYAGISTAPNRLGPSYIFNNLIVDLGDEFNNSIAAFKNGGGNLYTVGTTFFFNNTVYTKSGGISGIGYGEEDNPLRRKFYAVSRNNVLLQTKDTYSIQDLMQDSKNDFDFDLLGNTVLANNEGTINAKSGSEAHGLKGLPIFRNTLSGDFRLADNSLGAGKAADLCDFNNGSTDMGIFSSTMPVRKIKQSINKNKLVFYGHGTQTIELYSEESKNFKILKNDDLIWLDISADSYLISPYSHIKLNVTADLFSGQKKGMFLIKFDDGFSIPVKVYYNEYY